MKGSSSFSWDRLGNLRTVSQTYPSPNVTYIYDGQDRRVARKNGSSFSHKWLYDDQLRIVAEYNGSNVLQKRFVYGSRANVPDLMIIPSGASAGTYRLVTDQLGSVRRVLNVSGGASVQEMSYDAWGKALVNSPAGYQPFGFAGGLYDTGTGLVHFGAREYDPTIGRWLSRDAARWAGGLNFYIYADDDPVNMVDVDGLAPANPGSGGAGSGASSPPDPGVCSSNDIYDEKLNWCRPYKNARKNCYEIGAAAFRTCMKLELSVLTEQACYRAANRTIDRCLKLNVPDPSCR